jgi:glutamate--cysteine ligase
LSIATNTLFSRLRTLPPRLLANLRRGIEKESLRVAPDGTLAATPHPRALGSALAHPHITTDFSEAQLELITGVHGSADDCAEELQRIHQFVYRHVGDELMWCASMPCALPDEQAIPIGRYGRSNIGTAKTVYRIGLSHRYGRRMQTISGIHYNFSLPESAWPLPGLPGPNEGYFALIRNFRRHAWLLLLLFGASPAVCDTFVAGRPHNLERLAPGTLHLPYATSLRMGRLGYLSAAQDSLAVSYNDLASYADSLHDALTRPYPPYEAIGIREPGGGDGPEGYRQLATSLLQIENEFYSPIRPKRVTEPGERPLHALRSRGVQYVEVRAMDLDPFVGIGITPRTMRFLDVFLLHCLLSESPPDTPREIEALGRNKQRVAENGRDPNLRLERGDALVPAVAWAAEVLEQCGPVAAALDEATGGARYAEALAAARAAVADPASTPSARVLAAIRARADRSYLRFVLEHSRRHRAAIENEPFPPDANHRFETLAAASVVEQARIEAADDVPFETFRRRYLAHDQLVAS